MCVYMHVIYPTPNPIKLCNRKQKTGDIVRDNIYNVFMSLIYVKTTRERQGPQKTFGNFWNNNSQKGIPNG